MSSLLKTAMRKRKHDTEDSPGIQTQLPLTLFKRQLTLMAITYPLFSYIFHVEFAFSVQVVFRKSIRTFQLRTSKATISWKRIRGSNLYLTSCSLQASSILSFHRISTRRGIQSSAFFALSVS